MVLKLISLNLTNIKNTQIKKIKVADNNQPKNKIRRIANINVHIM